MNHVASDWIARHAVAAPEREAAHDLASGRRYSYRAFDRRIDRAAAWLRRDLGTAPGDRVALLAFNDTDVFELQFACQRAGAIFLPLNWRLAVPELAVICEDAAPTVLLHGPEFAEPATALLARGAVPKLQTMDNGRPSDYESGLAAAEPMLPVARRLDDVRCLLYTSGTTGRPKGVKQTYRMAVFNAVHWQVACDLTSRSRNLVFVPNFHATGLHVMANPVFHCGGGVVVMRSFAAGGALAALADPALRISHAAGVPTSFQLMAEEPGFAGVRFDPSLCLGVGGAAASPALIERWLKAGVSLRQGWGMTETGPLGLCMDGARVAEKAGSAGLPVLHDELRIVDAEGNDVADGDVGELLIRGPSVTPGYWKRPEADAAAFTADGWFRTGDAARRDEDGYYFIVDRWKDMFISGGENIYPVEVENALYRLDGVIEAAVIGIPDERWGEVGRAFIVARNGSGLDEAAVLAHCRTELARYKVPKDVRFVPDLPHNATGKILKHELPRA